MITFPFATAESGWPILTLPLFATGSIVTYVPLLVLLPNVAVPSDAIRNLSLEPLLWTTKLVLTDITESPVFPPQSAFIPRYLLPLWNWAQSAPVWVTLKGVDPPDICTCPPDVMVSFGFPLILNSSVDPSSAPGA